MPTFKRKEEKAVIDLKGIKVKVKRLTMDEQRIYRQAGEKIGLTGELGDFVMERSIYGCENLTDEDTGKPVEFTDEVREAIWREGRMDAKFLEAFLIFIEGNLKNLDAGSTVNGGDGLLGNAADASATETN